MCGSETFGTENRDTSKVQVAVFYFLRNIKTWEKRSKIKNEDEIGIKIHQILNFTKFRSCCILIILNFTKFRITKTRKFQTERRKKEEYVTFVSVF